MATSSLKYPNPTGVNVGDFVSVKLTPLNYFIWKSMILDLLKIHGLDGFINGTIPSPPEKIGETANQDYLEWKNSDGLVKRWILSTLNESILACVHRIPTAIEIWLAIQKGLSQPFGHEILIDQSGGDANLSRYITLSSAALNGEWKRAKEFLDKEPNAVRDFITGASETALMIAARSLDSVDFVRELLKMMDPTDVALGNYIGTTALHMAVGAGNIEAARLIVERNSACPNIFDKSLVLPLHLAAVYGERDMFNYLLSVTKEDVEPKIYEGESGVKLMHALVTSGLYDLALVILKKQPQLAHAEPTPLVSLAMKVSSFKSGTHYNFYQRFIYSRVPIKLENIETYDTNKVVPIKNVISTSISVMEKLYALLWKIAEITVPQIRSIKQTKTTNHHALELLKRLCQEIVKLGHTEATKILGDPVKAAACIGVHEVLEEILGSFPSAIYLTDNTGRTLFHLAIVNRQENIFNIIYQVKHKHVFMRTQDIAMNNCLHLAGCLELQQKLNLRGSAAGAALQMQRELQWFKAVEELTLKHDREIRNSESQTPAMIFTKSHKELVKEGEQWMKDTSNSCTIVGALIVTIVFAAAITVPGGNNGDNGHPIYKSTMAFLIFAVSDALALFTSTSSVIMFLSILTSRYGEQDFLYALPKRLIIGLATLFLSIIFMMIAFGATLQIMFGEGRSWILIPVAAFSCAPVMLFMSLQFPLLLDMIKSTYGSGIFGKRSNRILY